MKRLLYTAAAVVALSAGSAWAIDISVGGSGSASGSVGGTSATVEASATGAATATGGGGAGTIGGSGSVSGSSALAGNATVALSGGGNVQISRLSGLPVFTSDGVQVGVVANVVRDGRRVFLDVDTSTSAAASLGRFEVAASSATMANGQVTLRLSDARLRSSLNAATSANASVTRN